LTVYQGLDGPLVNDELVVQIGERENRDANYAFPDILSTNIAQHDIFRTLDVGIEAVAQETVATLNADRIDRLWLHVDLDVLDQLIMPAVDSPGEPGLKFDELARLIDSIAGSGRLVGVDVTIYDPELDPDRVFGPKIVECLVEGLRAWV
jgi:arginase